MTTAATRLQDRIIDDAETSLGAGRDVTLDAPTGTGKSRMFSKMAENAVRKKERTIILNNRKNLARQASKNLKRWADGELDISIGVEGNFDQSGDIVSTTVQTANLHIDELAKYDRVVVDEGHHALEGNSDYTNLLDELQRQNPEIRMVAASATFPDGMEGMYEAFRKADRHVITFEEAIESKLIDLPITATPPERLKNGKTIKEMVSESQRKGHGSDAEGIGGAIKKNLPDNWAETQAWHYAKNLSDRQSLSFFDTVKEAEAFAKEVAEQGLEVRTIHSGKKSAENDKALEDFEAGRIQGLVSVDMISEGYDIDARGLFNGKITTSLKEYKQIVGRGARSFGEDKDEKTLLIDMGASTHMHGEIGAQASINNIAKNIESTSRQTMDLSPESEEARAIWRPVEGGKAYAATIENTVIYAAPSDKGYIVMQSLKDRKGSRIQLLEIEGERKGRPSREAFRAWSEDAIRRSERSLARIMSREGGIDELIAEDWKRNGSSVNRNIEMMRMPPIAAMQSTGIGR